jgi:hypothetical protein
MNNNPDQLYPMAMIDGVAVTMGDYIMRPGPDEHVVYLNGDPFDCGRKNMTLVKNNCRLN